MATVQNPGSFRKLKDNAVASMIACVEIYNKPRMEYRDEISVILAVNAWEVLLKAIVRKSGGSIFEPKARNSSRKTISIWEALTRASRSRYWEQTLDYESVRSNLEILTDFRNNAVHLYAAKTASALMYTAMSASLRNFDKLLAGAFDYNLSKDINISILPIGLTNPVGIVDSMLSSRPGIQNSADEALAALLREKMNSASNNENKLNQIVFGVKVELQSVKNSNKSHGVTVGLGNSDPDRVEVLFKDRDPNVTHPLSFTEIANALMEKHQLGRNHVTSFFTQRNMYEDSRYCWIDELTNMKRFSHDARLAILAVPKSELQTILKEQNARRKKLSK